MYFQQFGSAELLEKPQTLASVASSSLAQFEPHLRRNDGARSHLDAHAMQFSPTSTTTLLGVDMLPLHFGSSIPSPLSAAERISPYHEGASKTPALLDDERNIRFVSRRGKPAGRRVAPRDRRAADVRAVPLAPEKHELDKDPRLAPWYNILGDLHSTNAIHAYEEV
jgi:hypothetical protein